MNKTIRNILIYVFLIAIAAYFIYGGIAKTEYREISFKTFMNHLENENVASVTIMERDHVLQGKLKDAENPNFKTNYPSEYDITSKLIENKVESINVDPQNNMWMSLLINFLPFLLIFVFWIFMMNQMQGGGNKVMSFGKSKAKLAKTEFPKVTFSDVAGLEEAIEEMQEIKEYLINPGKFHQVGAKIPKGILLYGAPGTGKTLLARAVAGEARVPFFSISGSEFVEMFVGVGASRVRDLFEKAKSQGPCIIFIDEIDAVGRHRGAGLGGGHDEREQTLNQLLVEMDGFDINDSIIVIAATNRPDILDPALLRPGRFDRHIVVDKPDLLGRKGILKVHTKGKPVAEDVDLEVLARRTPGFTGADLANMVNEAAILAARHKKKHIDMIEFEEAIDRVLAGPEKKTKVISEKEKKVIAFHESGHAIVAHLLENTNPVHKISIIPRGRALGYTLTLPTEDRYLVTRSELVDQLSMMLAGRVAEEMVFGDVTTGAQDDLERATKLSRKMICEYGMSDKLGPLTLGHQNEEVFLGKDISREPNYSQEIAFQIDKEVRRLVDESYKRSRKLLEEHKEQLDKLAVTLIENETIEKEELEAILEGKTVTKEDSSQSPKEDKEKEESDERKKEKLKKLERYIPGVTKKLRPAES